MIANIFKPAVVFQVRTSIFVPSLLKRRTILLLRPRIGGVRSTVQLAVVDTNWDFAHVSPPFLLNEDENEVTGRQIGFTIVKGQTISEQHRNRRCELTGSTRGHFKD